MNKVILMGNLGSDAVSRTTQNGKQIGNFNVCTTRTWKTPSGEIQKTEQWHTIEHWNGSDKLYSFLTKGVKVLIEGEIKYEEYDKDGEKRYRTKIICSNIEFAGKPQEAKTSISQPKIKNDVFDDDIPF